MKILCIAQERRDAQVAAHALHRIAPNVSLTWAQTPAAALHWIRDNPDAHGVILDARVEKPGCEALLQQVRGLGVDTPIAVIAPERLEGLSAALKATLDSVVDRERHKNNVLEARVREMEQWRQQAQQRLVDGQVQHDAALARTTRICTALQERLLELEGALHGADERHAAQIALTERLARRETELSAAVTEAVAVRSAVEQRLADAETARQNERHHAAEELEIADERYAVLETLLVRETAARTSLEERLAAAEIARGDADQEHAAEVHSLTARVRDREAQHDASLARTAGICTALQERLLELETAMRTADERHAADTAATERVAQRERELSAAVTDAIAARIALERRLSQAEIACQRTASELIAVTERCAELETQLGEQTAARSILEQRLAESEAARHDADQRHAAELAILTTRVADVQAQCDTATSQNAALERHVRENDAALEDARRGWKLEVAGLTEQAARRETEAGAALAEAITARTVVEHRLAATESAHQHAQQRAAAALTAAAERYAALEDVLGHESVVRTIVEERLAAAEIAGEHAARQHATELSSLTTRLEYVQAQHETATEEWLQRETELRGSLAEAIAARTAIENGLADAVAAHQHAQQSFAVELAEAIAARTAIGNRLADAEAAHHDAHQRFSAELSGAAERHTAIENRLGEEITARATLEERLGAAEAARHEADQRHATELASLTSRLVDLQAQYDAATGHIASIERHLADTVAALDEARRDWKSEITAAAEHLARREAELGTALAEMIAARTEVEDRLAAAGAAHQQAQDRAGAELAAAAERYTALQEHLNRESAARTSLEEQLTAAESARHDADQQHATGLESLTARLVELQERYGTSTAQITSVERQLADTVAARTDVEGRLAAAEAAYQQAQHRAAAELAAAAERQAALEDHLNRELAARTALEEQLVASETARHDRERQHAADVASLTAGLADVQAQHDAELRHREAVEQQLSDAAAALDAGRRDRESERTAAAEHLVRRETELSGAVAGAVAARTAVEQRLGEAEASHQQAQVRAAADLAGAAERHAALEKRVDAGNRDIARLQQESDGLRRQLTAMRTHAASLRREAGRVPVLQQVIEETKKENRRQFERAPYGLCECTRDGAITRVNHSLARLLGYRRSADLQRTDFVAIVFESATDLRWLIDRALRSGKVESVETSLRTRESRRLFVRLHSVTTNGSIVIAVEDLTGLRAVEQRLHEAQRMEAVARVASEVAATCDTLLRDVSQGGRQWLAGFASDTPQRQQGELLLTDVMRAAGFLRQFAVYGHKQISNLEPVSMQRVLRDMKPVLKRVLGDDIVLVLPKTTDRFDVDVDAERVERILVNVANYARERMPHGGRVNIQLAMAVMDHRFLASHPRVRSGAHVLLTITEIQGPIRPVPSIQAIPDAEPAEVPQSASDKPGMDLGLLVALIGDAGGHLWMSAEPAGNMTLQIHLPQRTRDEVMESAVPVPSPKRGRQLTRWFRN